MELEDNKIVTTPQTKWHCLIGLHQYEVYKEEKLTDVRGNLIGKVIINRCKHCGKIQENVIHLTTNY